MHIEIEKWVLRCGLYRAPLSKDLGDMDVVRVQLTGDCVHQYLMMFLLAQKMGHQAR